MKVEESPRTHTHSMPPPVIRRARKSLPERRLSGLQRELDSNLDRVELKAHLKQKADREKDRKRRGIELVPIPVDVRKNIISAELFAVECRLHREAGLPAPRKPWNLEPRQEGDGAAGGERRIGLVPFTRLLAQMVAMYQRTNGRRR
jgi:hypothetical protein